MDAQTTQPPSDPSSATAAAAAYPRWVILDPKLEIQVKGSSSSSTSGDSKTVAAARTSTGHLILVSLRLKEPPAVSRVCLQIPDGLHGDYSTVDAAHGDSVLLQVCLQEKNGDAVTRDRFVYSAGAAAAADPPRPPSLSLLGPLRHPRCSTGLLVRRRGEDDDDELVLVQLTGVPAAPDTPELAREADLSLLRFRSGGDCEWSVKRLPITFRHAGEVREREVLRSWSGGFPVGADGQFCWTDLVRGLGVMICDDVFHEAPRLRYLELPNKENIWWDPSNHNVCAAAGGGALRFVNVFPRCCCGGAGESSCERSCGAYVIETWTMRIGGIDDDDMEWVKDCIIDSSELWALDSYKGLRCSPLDHPIVSMDQPELICFWLHAQRDGYGDYTDRDLDLLMINTRSKTVHSVSRHEEGLNQLGDGVIPSIVSNFFNSYPGSGSSDAALTGHRQVDIERPLAVIVDEQLITTKDDDGSNPTTLASFAEPSAQASEIFEAFQEIASYGLGRDEQKLYRILSRDNCRRFKSLLRLPKNLRKDWLLMEIKTSEDASYDPTS